ncbi:MAG: Ppx/GppA family phosphatase [Bacteroidales bacterium]|nr:Ppx/GppA family phosphatase [Bacteroidales bacterium]MCF8403677.1 Ppx/GppA family phosphatase [Bacteroidales bacterium]
MIFAAIDIGSNAARLLFANVFELEGKILVEKATLLRIPTRLGEDVYSINRISSEKIENLKKTLTAFKLLLEVYNPVAFDACATAAMREAENGMEVLKMIRNDVGINVRLIDGIEEANIIRRTNKIGFEHPDKISMYIDVGGGSTDISILNNHEILGIRSFKIGTLRLLNDKVKDTEWEDLHVWLKSFNEYFSEINVVGSGGNINKINKLFGDPVSYTLTTEQLSDAFYYLKEFTLAQRMESLGLRPDRADVIVPAAEIFLYILNIIDVNKILVPKIGLADGLVYGLYEKYKKRMDSEDSFL